MSGPALLLAGFAVAGSTGGAAALLAALTAASAIGGPLLGVRLDRARRPGRLLAWALALYAVGLVVVLGALGRLPPAAVLPMAAATGLLGPALSGGWTAQLPVVAVKLDRVNALDAMTFDVAALAGPALAGAIATALGADTAVLIAAGLIAAALPAAWTLPARDRAEEDPRSAPVRAELAAGLRVLTSRPALARATVVSVGACAGQGVLAACLPSLGEQVLGGASRGPLLLTCAALAALLANAVLARRPQLLGPDAAVRAGALLQAVALALAASGWPLVVVAAAVLAGLGEGPQLTGLFAVRHREAPARLRAQVFTTGASLKITAFALGAALAGPVAARSTSAALVLAAALTAVPALISVPALRRAPRREDGQPRRSA